MAWRDTLKRWFGGKPAAKRDPYAGTYGTGAPGGLAAGKIDRLTASLANWSGAANADLDGSITILRARGRQLAYNNSYGRRFLSLVATNIVGPAGPKLQVRATKDQRDPNKPTTLDKAANDAIETHHARWSKRCDVAGRRSLPLLMRLAVKACARDGEALIRIVRERRLPYGIGVQLLEADRLDETFNQVLPHGGAIRQGVEIDSYGRPVAYWLRKSHPGERYQQTGAAVIERVPAGDIIHLFLPERAEQQRGYTWFHAVLLDTAQLGEFKTSAVIAARIGASKIAALERSEEADPTAIEAGADGTSGGNLQMSVEAGELFELPPGYKLNSWNPEYPHANFESFLKSALEGLGAGLDVAAHNLSGNMSGVNYSSARIAELAEREQWMVLQDWFIDAVCLPLYREWLASALIRGDITFPVSGKALPADKLDKFTEAAAFRGRRWRWVDPAKEIAAFKEAVDLRITSRTRIAAEQGDDFDDVLDELALEEDMLDAAGLTAPIEAPKVGAGGTAPAEKPETDDDAEADK